MKAWPNRGSERKAEVRLPSTPTITSPPQVISPEAARLVDDIVTQSKNLIDAEDRLRAASLREEEKDRHIAFLEKALREAEYKYAFYQRHSVSLHTRLTDIAGDFEHIIARIDNALKESKTEADRGADRPINDPHDEQHHAVDNPDADAEHIARIRDRIVEKGDK